MVAGMLMPMRELRAIYEILFRDGVMVAKKDKRPQTMHPELEGVRNLQVMRAMVSLKSRDYVKETFVWRHFYWYLTNEGIVYLRDYLHLPPEIVPASLQRMKKPVATTAFGHRGAHVQSVDGPTSYVPKPGRRGEAESQESLTERHGYRHTMMGPGEKETSSERTPRFRGRPLAAEPVRPKASWEVEDQPPPLFSSRGSSFRSETAVVEDSKVRRFSRQHPDGSSEQSAATSQERRVSEVQEERPPTSVQVQRAAWRQDAPQTSLSSVASKTAPPFTRASGGATSKNPAEPSSPKTNKEELTIADEKVSTKSGYVVTSISAITTLADAEIKEEKTKKVAMDPIRPAEVKATAETANYKAKPQTVVTMAAAAKTTATKPANKDVKEEKTRTASAKTATDDMKAQTVITKASTQDISKLSAATSTSVITKPANKDVKEKKTSKGIIDQGKPAEVKVSAKTATDDMKVQTVITMASPQETSKLSTSTSTTAMTKLVKKDAKEEKTKKTIIDPVKSSEVKASAKTTTDDMKAQTVSTVPAAQETSKLLSAISTSTSTTVITKPANKDVKEKKTTTVIVDPVQSSEVKALAKTATDDMKAQTVITKASAQETSKLSAATSTSTTVVTQLVTKDVTEEKTKKVIVDPVKPAEVKATAQTATDDMKAHIGITVPPAQETSKFPAAAAAATPIPVITTHVKGEKPRRAKVNEEPVKPAEPKAPVDVKMDVEKSKTTAQEIVTQETTKPKPKSTTSEAVKEISKEKETQETTKPQPSSTIKPQPKSTTSEAVKEISKVKETLETTKPQPKSTTSEAVKEISKVKETQETTKPQPKSTTSVVVKEISKVNVHQEPVGTKVTSLNLSSKPKTDEAPQKTTTVTESSIFEVKTTIITTTLSAVACSTETEIITKHDKTDVKVTPRVKKDEHIVPEEVLKVSVQGVTPPQLSQHVAPTEGVMETKQMVDASSKSKKKKKKSSGESSKIINTEELSVIKLEKEKPCVDKAPEEGAGNTLTPLTSEPLSMSTSTKTRGPVEEHTAQAKIDSNGGEMKEDPKHIPGKPIMEVPKQTEDQSSFGVASLPSDQSAAVPPVESPDTALVKVKVEGGGVSKITHGAPCSEDKLKAKGKCEGTTVTMQQITQVKLIQASPEPQGQIPLALSESQTPTVNTKSPLTTEKAAEESSKGKKKGRGKKPAQAAASDTVNTKPVFSASACPDITPSPEGTVIDGRVTTSEVTELSVSAEKTPERMCSVQQEAGQAAETAAAVVCEAPADKGEVEPPGHSAGKVKREVPKPKTSSTAREAPAAGGFASAEEEAEAAAAQTQAGPLGKRQEPPRVAQRSARQAAECSTEKSLSLDEASQQKGETKKKKKKAKDSAEDTPSATATPAAAAAKLAQLRPSDTCHSDEAAMKRKIVVVEEIVEVKQVISPEDTGEQSAPPPAQPEEEEEEEEDDDLDLDVLQELAIERALFAAPPPGSRVRGASPEAAWDHSLDEPEEKTWPHFIEGWCE
ncbi:Plectin [Liparis tanakae]|uniref:Plectin n=1 Tax=Liparis tanakae TaxID=230148 RepID=A0A4Z2H053_9TELE|nr:Plectin [Liparis tanakae]